MIKLWINESVRFETRCLNFVYSKTENVEMAELLIENGADVNIRYASGKTPLSLATENGNFRACLQLVRVIKSIQSFRHRENRAFAPGKWGKR